MGGMWKLENRELGDSTTEIFITALARNSEVRTATEAVHGGTEIVERLGRNHVRLNLTFTILGQDTKKHEWAAFIMGIIENRTDIRLESPSDDDDLRLIDDFRAIQFTPEGRATLQQLNRAQYDVTVPIIVRGVPVADGGAYMPVEDLQEDFI